MMDSIITWRKPSNPPPVVSEYQDFSAPILIAHSGNPMSTLIEPIKVVEGLFWRNAKHHKGGTWHTRDSHCLAMIRAVAWTEMPVFPPEEK